MARLGELLVAAGLLTSEQIERALRAQVMWGARLGTNLVELSLIDLEQLTTYLGNQHRMPAAYARHFEKVDHELQLLLSPEVAETYCCLPLLRAGKRRDVVLASVSPLDKKTLALVADELVVEPHQLIVSIAAELRIRYQLEKVYGIPRPARFMRTPGTEATPFPQFEVLADFEDSVVDNVLQPPSAPSAPSAIEAEDERTARVISSAPPPALTPAPTPAPAPAPGPDDSLTLAIDAALTEMPSTSMPALAELDDLPADIAVEGAVPRAVETEASSGRELRKYVRTIADAADSERALGRISIRRVAMTPPGGIVEPTSSAATLAETTRAIRRSKDRDRVAELSMDALFRFAPSCHAATMMVLRGQVATTWKGFCRSGAPHPELAVPLDQPGLVPRAAQGNQTARAPSSDLGPIDLRLMVSLGRKDGELLVVPITIAGEVMCVIAMVTEAGAAADTVDTAESVAAAAGSAFARLMRDAGR